MKLLKFYLDKCPPCKVLQNYIDNNDLPNIEIIQVDVKKYQNISKKYNVGYVPQIIQIDDKGVLIRRWTGLDFIDFAQKRIYYTQLKTK